MNAFKAFRYYIALKLHFSKDKFDVFKNRGNLNGSLQAFQSRNDRGIFERLARRYDTDQELIQFLVANFAYGNENMIYGMDDAEENYTRWRKRKESMTFLFNSDLSAIQLEAEKNNLDQAGVLYFYNNNYPLVLKMLLGKSISIETVHILDSLTGIVDTWKNAPEAIILEQDIRVIKKLYGFVKFDREKMSNIYKEFTQSLMWVV